MFENEIKFISDFSLNRIKNLGSFVTFEKLSASELHPAIVSYISAELDYMIYRDRKKLLQDSIFDYTGREISDHFNVIAAEIKKNKKISIDDIEKLILQAVSFNINYVVRPKWSVTKLIYNDQDFISVDELDKMLSYLYYYDYVKNVLSAYTSRRRVIQLTLTEFDLILNKIDRELFKANTEELINNALHSIADFFNIGGIDKTKISLAAVEIFLKEKNLMDSLLKLRHSIPNSFRKKYEITDIKKVLYSTDTIYPESISGTMERDPLVNGDDEPGFNLEDDDTNPEPGSNDEKIETIEYNSTEIIAEEKIKSKENSDKLNIEGIVIEETEEEITPEAEQVEEDLLPIEEEFGQEITGTENDRGNDSPEEITIDTDREDTSLSATLPDSTIEDDLMEVLKERKSKSYNEDNSDEITGQELPGVENEIVVDQQPDEDKLEKEEDDLLAFYENELSALEGEDITTDHLEDVAADNDDDLVKNDDESSETITDDTPGNEISIEEPDDTMDNLTENEKQNDEEIDFSIFEDEDAEQDFNDILKKVSSDFQGDLADIPGEKQNDVKEDTDIPDPGDTSSTDADLNLSDKTDDDISPDPGKKVIDEMLDDYFGSELPKNTGSEKNTEDLISTKFDATKNATVEKEEPELPSPAKQETPKEIDDNIFDTELASDILEGTTFGDDISSMINEIDDIIESNDFGISDSNTTGDKTGSIPLDDKFELKEDDKPDVQNINEQKTEFDISGKDSPSVEKTIPKKSIRTEKEEKKTSNSELPIREKDLFSYLSRKEVKKIVSNVFGSDYEDFVTTIEKISECSAYKEATEILKGVFFTYRVSPYSKEAVVLTNAVSSFFRQV